ncbi:MAG: endonuclease III domain-containing protein [Alicyclobacillaceae bacterium]|nr:endonuclease III domain-containing protein [Alicyclobacillaceae bacterium]
MFHHFGDRRWWPAETQEEVIIGAILVQGVAWSNTAKAIHNLRSQDLLSLRAIHAAAVEDIEACIVPTRYYRAKARKLKAFAEHVQTHHGGDIGAMLAQPMGELRSELLSIYGIGPETADDILLYAAGLPSFVVDTYTRRIFHRLGYTAPDIPYEVMRAWFMDHLPPEAPLYNQYHALLDAVGHNCCTNRRPQCERCPLAPACNHARAAYSAEISPHTPPQPA